MRKRLDMKLVEEVATLLAQDAATHQDFFGNLADILAENGYILEAHQRGIGGAYLQLVKQEAGQ